MPPRPPRSGAVLQFPCLGEKMNRAKLRRWHIWLGWAAAIPVLVWVISGLVMVARPIEEVRGSGLLRDAQPVRITGTPIPPSISGVPLASLTLEQRAAGPRWVVELSDGKIRLADPATGLLLPGYSAGDARREVEARYTGKAKIESVTRTDPDKPPLELRRPIAAWQVTMDDDTHFFVDAASGAIVGTRTGWWRFYDFMWGLHIMDPVGREDTHNPFVIVFGIIALGMAVLGTVVLPMTVKRRRARGSEPA
jgi:uncharacterized iron-regulated membrane protein